jgi:hypothetical protein
VFRNGLDQRQPIHGDHGLRWDAAKGERFPSYAFAPKRRGDHDYDQDPSGNSSDEWFELNPDA